EKVTIACQEFHRTLLHVFAYRRAGSQPGVCSPTNRCIERVTAPFPSACSAAAEFPISRRPKPRWGHPMVGKNTRPATTQLEAIGMIVAGVAIAGVLSG